MQREGVGKLERDILDIANKIGAEKRTIELKYLYKSCISHLEQSKEEILNSIKKLYQKKYIVEGSRLTKETILDNEIRQKIFEYIKMNPGTHNREIRDIFGLGAYRAFRHLKYLEIFGLLRSKRFMNKKVYFLVGTDENQDETILVLRNERTKLILHQINIYKKVRLVDIEKNLDLQHGQIQPHIKKLLKYNIIESIVENDVVFYIPKADETVDTLSIKREFDYVGGNIRFKVALNNTSNMSISNISVTLTPSDQFFWEDSIQRVPILPPNNSRGVDFTLIPNTCGKSTIFGAVSYQDAYGNAHTITIPPKEIAIKCPLVIPQTMSEYEINKWIKTLKKSTTKIDYGDISQNQAFNIALSQIKALDLSKVNENKQELSTLYSGKVKVTGQEIVVKLSMDQPNIMIEVWANDLTQTTGLLAYIRNLIIISLEQSLKALEKSEDVARKIIDVFNYNNELKECFNTCCNGEKIKKISTSIAKIKNGLKKYYPDFKVLDSMNKWSIKLNGMFEEESCIDIDTAIELESDLIDWLKQLRDLVNYDIKLYKEDHEDFEKYIEDFEIGQENIDKNLELIEKIYGLSILNYVIVIHQNNGLAIYQEQLGPVELNADLVSGFITAIQSFGSEISKKETPVTGLKYKNFNIEIGSGEYIQAIILLNGKTNDYLVQNLNNFVHEFENQYEHHLKSFSGNISQFNNSGNIFHKLFEF